MRKISIMLLLFFCAITSLRAQKPAEIHKTFPVKAHVQISTASGDIIIKVSAQEEIKVDILYSGRAEGSFEPEFIESGNRLKIKEHWSGFSSGNVTWTITVPSKTEIEFSTASGDVSVEGIKNMINGETASGDISVEDTNGELELSAASGDISLENVQGDADLSTASGDIKARELKGKIEMSTASGDIKISEAEGSLELSCASGDIEADKVILKEASSFSTASGDVEVGLAQSPVDDLELSTASGDIVLDYNGNELKGYFECTVRKDRGRISAPEQFQKEVELERHGKNYVKRSFSRGEKPKIILETSSGSIRLSQ